MSRFANPNATARFTVGACECPGTPHTEDWMDLRTELGAEDVLRLEAGGIDALEVLCVRWNLLDIDGSEAPVDREHLERLYVDVFIPLQKWTKANLRTTTKLPNGSAARSGNTSRAERLPTPTPTTGSSSTTLYSPPVDGATTTSGSLPLSS